MSINIKNRLYKQLDSEKKGYVTIGNVAHTTISFLLLGIVIGLILYMVYNGILSIIYHKPNDEMTGAIGVFVFIPIILAGVVFWLYSKISKIKITKYQVKQK